MGHYVPSLRTAASLIDLCLDLALNLSEKGFGFLAAIHAPGDQHIPVSSENYGEYWQTLSWWIVNGSGNAGHKFLSWLLAKGRDCGRLAYCPQWVESGLGPCRLKCSKCGAKDFA